MIRLTREPLLALPLITITGKHVKRHQKYIDQYGHRSYHHFYQPLREFFGEGSLAGVTLIDDTTQPRKKSFQLKITRAYEKAKKQLQQGKRVKIIITDESIAG
ncbi:hypothetical protein K438DRAFT_1956649 [Mycena galopus ATCC 62051]|nr:hypothetical protein K438DRAFT_1956649 [Mycena galopus ATCC 62051]